MQQLLLMAMICTAAPSTEAQEQASRAGTDRAAARPDNRSRETSYELDNGLEVILAPDDRSARVGVNIWYHVGADHEPAGQRGIAHLAEHLMFEGSAHVGSGEHVRRLRAIGAGALNAHTGRHRTRYLTAITPGALETLLWLEADRMGFVLQGLSQGAFERERDVVLRELEERVDLRPYGRAEARLWAMLFPAGHSYHVRIEGLEEHIRSLELEDVRRFIGRWYGPSNATLVITGRFRVEDARRMVERYFAGLPAGEHPPEPIMDPVSPGTRRVLHYEEPVGSKPAVLAGWLAPAEGT